MPTSPPPTTSTTTTETQTEKNSGRHHRQVNIQGAPSQNQKQIPALWQINMQFQLNWITPLHTYLPTRGGWWVGVSGSAGVLEPELASPL